ncbi:thioredoxin family protein [Myxococcota bacterium]|nr:thioredoxin family protein [Myxococcota bacterium]
MEYIDENTQKIIATELEDLKAEVKFVVFTADDEDCEFCEETLGLITELSSLSNKLSMESCDIDNDEAIAEKYGVDKIPAIVLLRKKDNDEKDFGIRYYGIPAGHEFMTLLKDITQISTGEHRLSESTLDALNSLSAPIKLEVFVTPSCVYCPRAALLAHAFALASDHISADVIEAGEFDELSANYGVMSVPMTVLNERVPIDGVVPEEHLLAEILKVAGK